MLSAQHCCECVDAIAAATDGTVLADIDWSSMSGFLTFSHPQAYERQVCGGASASLAYSQITQRFPSITMEGASGEVEWLAAIIHEASVFGAGRLFPARSVS